MPHILFIRTIIASNIAIETLYYGQLFAAIKIY